MKKIAAMVLAGVMAIAACGCSAENGTQKEKSSKWATLDDPEWRSGYLKFLDSGEVYAANQVWDLDYFYTGIVFEECKFALVEVDNNEIPELLMFDGNKYALVRCDNAEHKTVPIAFNGHHSDSEYYVGSQKVSDIWSSKRHYSNEEIREVIRDFGRD